MEQIREQSKAGRFDLFVDLHNPGRAIGSRSSSSLPADILAAARPAATSTRFLESAGKEITGPLTAGRQAARVGAEVRPQVGKDQRQLGRKNAPGHVVAVCLETAWNTPQSTPENYRRVGRELGLAIERYLREPVRAAKE